MKLRTLNGLIAGLIAINLVILALCGYGLYVNTNEVSRRFEYSRRLITLANNAENTCTLLTEYARSFSVTNKGLDLQLFANEYTQHVKKVNTFESLEALDLNPEERGVLSGVQEKFEVLSRMQLDSVRLVTEAFDADTFTLPIGFELPESPAREQVLTAQQKIKMAQSLVFGSVYRKIRSEISTAIKEFRGTTENRASTELQFAQRAASDMLRLYISAIVFLFLSALALLFLYYSMNSIPLKSYISALRGSPEGTLPELIPRGTHETRELADTFNHLRAEKLLSEKALRDSERRLRLHLELMPIAAIESTNNFDIVSWNPASQKTFGYNSDEAIGKNIFELLIPEDKREAFKSSVLEAYVRESFSPAIVETLTKQGEKIIGEWYNTRLLDSDGKELGWTTMAMDITVSQKEAEEILFLAQHDPLTGLFNRRFIYDKLAGAYSGQAGSGLSMIMLDIDFFKRFNDRYGHDCGDYVLIHLAQIMQDAVRSGDFVSRWGGEEFLFLLPETPLADAREIAQRICGIISEKNFYYNNKKLRITISAGISHCADKSLDECIRAADAALLAAKTRGRNRVCAENELQ